MYFLTNPVFSDRIGMNPAGGVISVYIFPAMRMKSETIRGLLFDLSGTIYVGSERVPGALEALTRLREIRMPMAFVTNTTSRPVSALVEKLEGLGLPVSAGDIVTPARAATALFKREGYQRCHLVVPEPVKADFPGIEDVDQGAEALVLGDLGGKWDYEILNSAYRSLREGLPFYALARNRVFRDDDGWRLDLGPFVVALEYACERSAEVVGKPANAFFQAGLERLGLPAEAVALVGDDCEADVGGAMQAGLGGVLVRTGKFSEASLRQSGVEPDAVLDSVASLPEWLGV